MEGKEDRTVSVPFCEGSDGTSTGITCDGEQFRVYHFNNEKCEGGDNAPRCDLNEIPKETCYVSGISGACTPFVNASLEGVRLMYSTKVTCKPKAPASTQQSLGRHMVSRKEAIGSLPSHCNGGKPGGTFALSMVAFGGQCLGLTHYSGTSRSHLDLTIDDPNACDEPKARYRMVELKRDGKIAEVALQWIDNVDDLNDHTQLPAFTAASGGSCVHRDTCMRTGANSCADHGGHLHVWGGCPRPNYPMEVPNARFLMEVVDEAKGHFYLRAKADGGCWDFHLQNALHPNGYERAWVHQPLNMSTGERRAHECGPDNRLTAICDTGRPSVGQPGTTPPVSSSHPAHPTGSRKPPLECELAQAQSPRDVSADAVGTKEPVAKPLAAGATALMKHVNTHFHQGAEHKSDGQYDLPPPGGAGAGGGWLCRRDLNPSQGKHFKFKFCKNVRVGSTYEIQWAWSSGGDGKFGDGLQHAFTRVPNAELLFQAQVVRIVNDDTGLKNDDLINTWITPRDGVRYVGSTTGTSYDNGEDPHKQCSPFEATWHVDRECRFLAAASMDRMCQMMVEQHNMTFDIAPHGSRRIVLPSLATSKVLPLFEQDESSDGRESALQYEGHESSDRRESESQYKSGAAQLQVPSLITPDAEPKDFGDPGVATFDVYERRDSQRGGRGSANAVGTQDRRSEDSRHKWSG